MKASRGLAAVLLLAPVSALSIGSADLRKGVSPPVAPGIPVAFGASSTTTLDSFVSSIVNSAAASPTSQASAPDISSLISRLSSQLVSDISASSEKTKSTIATTTSLQSTSTSSSSSAMATSSPTGGSGTANSVNSQGSQDTGGGKDNKKLTIILAVVLSILGLVLICIAAVLVMRYRRGQSPFSRLAKRGATPIDDDEIATWRTNSQGMAQTSPGTPNGHNHTRTASSIIFTPSPGYSYTVHSHPNSPSPNNSPNHKAQASSSSHPILQPPLPALVARAPNSRTGLTDETVPGADPFLPPLKRQSTRLSKAQGHARTKSRRSSRGSVASANPQTPSGGTGAGYGLGRFSFDRAATAEKHTPTAGARTRSLSERTGGGLDSNPFGGQDRKGDPNPFTIGSENGPGGLWPPPTRKMSFPEGMVGVAS